MYQLILASESPRRKTLLEEAGFSFLVFPVNISETFEKNLSIDHQILTIAERKALVAFERIKRLDLDEGLRRKLNTTKDFLILAADTVVVLEQKPLGKPRDKIEAYEILSSLSGREHQVKTAVCLVESRVGRIYKSIETTNVKFSPLSREQIESYIDSGEPMDKAGAYGIQGGAGLFVEKIEGSYDNVVGLPVGVFQKLILENNLDILNVLY